MKKLALMVLTVFCTVSIALSQRTITGSVIDSEGLPLIGANVLVENTDVGTITDIDGFFTIDGVPADAENLIISYTGYTEQSISILGTDNVVATLREGALLDELVISALGTARNSRDVVYANQTVGADDLLSAPNNNTLEALRGKAAGVRITTGSGAVGSSSKVVLRSEASLTGNNNALIVVDGIAIENNSTTGGEREGEGGFSDYGNRFNDINPEDIESVTILKGPSATSLYGSRGASGVLLITTKKGKKGNAKVNFSTTTSVEKAYVLLQRQNEYGQGLINPDGSNNFDSGENFSWGPKFDGVVRPWTSPIDIDGDGTLEYLSRPYSAVDNQLENFFRTGRTNTNTISFSGGSEGYTYYASYGNTYQKGILENTDYNRHNFTLSASAQLTEKLTSNFKISYANIDQNTAQQGSRAFEGQNAYANAIQAPVNIPYNELRDYNNPYHGFAGYYGSYTVNPYFVLNEYVNNGKINNFLGNFSLNYNLMKGLDLNTRFGANVVSTKVDQATPSYAYEDHFAWGDRLSLSSRERQTSAGEYRRNNIQSRNIDWTTSLSYSKFLDSEERMELKAVVGNNIFDRQINQIESFTTGGLVVPGVYNLNNSVNQPNSTQNDLRYRIIGFLGNVTFGLDNKLFLEYSARQDHSSTLPRNNQSFFYQAFGASAILSEYFDLESSKVNFLKARVSYGTTGKDASQYLLNSVFFGNPIAVDYNDIYDITYPLNGQTGFTKGSLIGNPDLKPELTTTLELGMDLGMFDDKISLEYTYYSSNHDDQIVQVSLPRSSGYSQTALNVGKITNKGHEVALTYRPFTNTNGFHWDLNLTYAKNTNEVVKISDETDELTIWDSGRGVRLVAEEGESFGTFKAQIPKLDPNGNPIVESGLPVYTTEDYAVGNVQPDWIAGLGSSFGYKNLTFNFLIDGRMGSEIFSLTKSATEFNGTALTTTFNDRQPYVIENSVVEIKDENGNVTGYEPNTVQTLIDSEVFDGNYGRNVLNGSFLKLREIGMRYNLPSSVVDKLNVGKASLGLSIRNLKFWLPEENTFGDPETNGPGTTQQNITGIETSQTPVSRSYGINLNVQF